MKVVINTQQRENYAAHDSDNGFHWKNKGGDTYIVTGVSEDQAHDPEFLDMLKANIHIETYAFEETVIGVTSHSDSTGDHTFCEEWETPYYLSVEDGVIKGCRITFNNGNFRSDIAIKREMFELRKGIKANYSANYMSRNGVLLDSRGDRI